MNEVLNDTALDQLFREARTYNAWLDRPVSDETLRHLYDLMKWGPTSANTCPARILFLRTKEAKERLRHALSPGNVEKTMAAPVTAIIGYDELFYDQGARLFPHRPEIREWFARSPDVATTALRNGSLQGGYFIMAARSLGLDCGPMSGFDNAKVDAEFFTVPAKGSEEERPVGRIRSNFLCNLGYGDPAGLYPRSPRLDFEVACRLL